LGPIGNKNLEPEKSVGWDFGLEQQFFQGRLLFGATYFYSTYKNLISFDFLQGYINIGKALSKGIEITAEAKPSSEFLVRASYTRMEAKDKEKDSYLLRRPRDKFTATVDWSFLEKWSLHFSAIYTGKRDDVDFSAWPYPQLTLPGFTLFNVCLSFDLSSRLQFFGRLDNLLNEKYEMILGYGTPGFSAYGGFKVLF
jgi:vitamin B12 transporter